jgi:hypothetical protein
MTLTSLDWGARIVGSLSQGDKRLAPIDPVYALPVSVLRSLGIPSLYTELELPETKAA